MREKQGVLFQLHAPNWLHCHSTLADREIEKANTTSWPINSSLEPSAEGLEVGREVLAPRGSGIATI